ncbi:MAG: hypothetical protein UV73_C0011G0044 [Candidatus Gottesmanbacteria bacterium GW2011_GWA2_43_14]|uniref:Uncharacterized protein n=1 Tax=Candidatus Gottesmanbacteria bacterium GW2011_GWA2_43_14 TaxID=1618443 RepID=A0A0G1DFJ1_9BACT|nr:MAG: hypothetical protein UV73_C0011G0044 [Candidatus Gottesmanbacteria bacterium GW2011_GWA2_43_14]
MKRAKTRKICPKCKNILTVVSILFTGYPGMIEEKDVTGWDEVKIRLCTASGVVPISSSESVEKRLLESAGLGFLLKKLACKKCGYSEKI